MDQIPLILIVDDIEENLQVLGGLFKYEGLRTAIASNGTEAIELAKELSPDLIILDVQMPDMDGFQVCSILKNTPSTKNIPILFLTGHNGTNDVVKGFDLGAVDYITKPFDQKELLARVKTHIELKLSNEKYEKLNKELKAAIAAKDRFFSIIAHDLRTPFSSLLGFSEILKNEIDEISKEELHQYASIIYSTANDTFKLLDNLLQWSRMQTGSMQFSPEEIDLHRLVEKIKRLYQYKLEEKNITFINMINQAFDLKADLNMLDTILRNLISNAVKFTFNGGKVEVDAYIKESYFIITVQDTGTGINEDDKKKLFHVEEHVTNKGTNEEAGTGLGLILCKEMVAKHKGKIWFESEKGKGTKFYISIPVNL